MIRHHGTAGQASNGSCVSQLTIIKGLAKIQHADLVSACKRLIQILTFYAIMTKKSERPIAAQGAWGTVEYAVLLDNSCPAEEFVDGLEQTDQTKLANVFLLMAEKGRITNVQKFRQLSRPIWEFKIFGVRTPSFRDGFAWVITHGFYKSRGNRTPKPEIERARRIMSEDLQRKKGRLS